MIPIPGTSLPRPRSIVLGQPGWVGRGGRASNLGEHLATFLGESKTRRAAGEPGMAAVQEVVVDWWTPSRAPFKIP